MIFKDQTGEELEIEKYPERIVSAVPSLSELLYDLGLYDMICGVTEYCTEPPILLKSQETIGGTKSLKIPKIRQLKPDLIVANKEENIKGIVNILRKEFPVLVTCVDDYKSALEMLSLVGNVTGTMGKAAKMIGEIKMRFGSLPAPVRMIKAAYLIWKGPLMAAGGDTFINSMMEFCGFENIFINSDGRYPKTDEAELRSKNPELLLLSSEPYEFTEKHKYEFGKILPDTIVKLVNGKMFSWYGSSMLKIPAYLENLINDVNLH